MSKRMNHDRQKVTFDPVRIRAQAYGETRWFDTIEEAQEWVADQYQEAEGMARCTACGSAVAHDVAVRDEGYVYCAKCAGIEGIV